MYFEKSTDNFMYPNEEYFQEAFSKILKHIYDNSGINPYALNMQINVNGCGLVKVTLLNEQDYTFEPLDFEIDNNNSILEEYFSEENLEKYTN